MQKSQRREVQESHYARRQALTITAHRPPLTIPLSYAGSRMPSNHTSARLEDHAYASHLLTRKTDALPRQR